MFFSESADNPAEVMDEGDSSLTEEKISADLDKKVEILEASEVENGGAAANVSAKEKSESNVVSDNFILGFILVLRSSDRPSITFSLA